VRLPALSLGDQTREADLQTAARWISVRLPPKGLVVQQRLASREGHQDRQGRLIPVHPNLAKVLKLWREDGWMRLTGRKPELDDLILPGPKHGEHLTVDRARKRIVKDMEKLGMRRRRLYDTRRTFVSLAIGDGIPRDLVRWITHGASGEVIDDYTEVPWASLCREIVKLQIELKGPWSLGETQEASSEGEE
jgi:integrase